MAGLGLTIGFRRRRAAASPGEGCLRLPVGAITLKETVGKFVLCALQLGSGASLGVEGPTVQICAGVSSFWRVWRG